MGAGKRVEMKALLVPGHKPPGVVSCFSVCPYGENIFALVYK